MLQHPGPRIVRSRTSLLVIGVLAAWFPSAPHVSAQGADPAPVGRPAKPAEPPAASKQDPPANPVTMDATVTVFGEAEPQKTDVGRDVRSLPVHSSLLQEVEIRRRSFEAGIRTLLFNRLDLHGNLWRADNSNEIRGIPPGGSQFESLGKSRRDGGGVDAKIFLGPVTRVFGSVSWLDATLLTPATPAANRLPDIPDFVHQAGIETGIPLPHPDAHSFVLLADYSFYGWKNLNTTGSLRSERYERLTFRALYERHSRYRLWVGGFAYPGSRVGESAFLFGSKIGVRPNPRLSVDAGLSYLF